MSATVHRDCPLSDCAPAQPSRRTVPASEAAAAGRPAGLDHFGIDPLFFGLLIALNIQTSFLSPPVAMAPFYLKGVAPKEVSINDTFAGVMPFIFIVIASMVMLYTIPQIGLWLPGLIYGR